MVLQVLDQPLGLKLPLLETSPSPNIPLWVAPRAKYQREKTKEMMDLPSSGNKSTSKEIMHCLIS